MLRKRRGMWPVIRMMASYFFLLEYCYSFNIDTIHPLVYKDPSSFSLSNTRESYFGYSVQYLFNQKDRTSNSAKWLLVGAPRANSTFPKLSKLVEPGQVYRCLLKSGNSNQDKCQPLMIESEAFDSRNIYYKDRKDNGWLGGSMDVQNPISGRVAICGYRWANQRSSHEHYMNGACYWSPHQVSETENFVKVLPLVSSESQIIGNGTYNYAYGQSGFSVHMALNNKREEMILGAPGVLKWTGAVIRVSDDLTNTPSGIPSRRKRQDNSDVIEFGQVLISNVANVSQLEPNDYFGYSVHSGIFHDDGKLLYVSGAPRASGMRGKVLIFDFVPGKGAFLDIKVELIGGQLGEYFGSSVLALDLTRDGKSELLVGAPQHSLHPELLDRSGDEGKVYLYVNSKDGLVRKEALYGSKVKGARFGTAMASIGDINLDGFNDVAIGAPYENEKGAVYVYLGGLTGIKRHPFHTYWQKIAAADFVKPLDGMRGFGISMVAADVDSNEYPDLAVGSFLSGHVLVLRSQPIIQLKVLMNTESKGFIDSKGGSVQLKVCSSFDRPVKATAQSSIPQICVGYSLYFDTNYTTNPRLSLETPNGTLNQQPFNFSRLVTAYPSCQTFRLAVKNLPYYSQDFSRPARLLLYTNLLSNIHPIHGQCLENQGDSVLKERSGSKQIPLSGVKTPNNGDDYFCPACPVLDATEKNYVESSVSFISECGEDDVCTEDLEVGAAFLDSIEELIVGNKKAVWFQVTLVNYGEPSYVTTLDIYLSSYIALKRTPASLCQTKSFTSGDEQAYSCHLRINPLKSGKTEKMDFQLDLESATSGLSDSLSIVVEARMSGAAAKGRRPRFNLTAPLKTLIDMEIQGNAVEEQLTYVRANKTANVTVLEQIAFQHLYEVRNQQPSPANAIDVGITFPVSISLDRSRSLKLIDQESVEASQKGVLKKTECRRTLENLELMTTEKEFIDLNTGVSTEPAFKYAQANRTAFIDCFNTPGVRCAQFVCSLGPLTSQTPITVSFTGFIRLKDILGFIGKKDVFIYSSVGRVVLVEPKTIDRSSDQKPDIAIASTHVLPQGPPVAQAVASWIIALSVLAGILLLSLIVFGLYKIGFFRRQRYPQDALVQDTATPDDGNSENLHGEQLQTDQDVSQTQST